MRAAVLGGGRIGSRIAEEITKGAAGEVTLVAVYDRHPEKVKEIARRLRVKGAKSVSELLKDKTIDVIVEAASPQAVIEYGEAVLRAGKTLVMLSSGALANESFRKRLVSVAKRSNKKIHVPSGSIVGLDGVKGASIGGLSEVVVEYRRSPLALVKDLERIGKGEFVSVKKPTKIFEGSAAEAVKLFPHRLNITSSAGLAGLGPSKTIVRVVLDPKARNRTTIRTYAKGKGGDIFAESIIKTVEDAGTAYFPIASTLRTLRGLGETLQVGT